MAKITKELQRRRFRRKRRMNRRKAMKIKKPLALQTHSFCERKITDLVITCDNESTATGMFKSFVLDDINGAASYKNLFEYYRIDKVVATFRYKTHSVASTASTVGPRANEINPLLYFKVDHNDVAADSLLLMRQSMKTKEKMLTNNRPEFTITLKPAIKNVLYTSAAGTDTYSPKWGQWLSTDDGQVEHFGLKAYAIAYRDSNSNPGDIQVSFKYYISFKNNE